MARRYTGVIIVDTAYSLVKYDRSETGDSLPVFKEVNFLVQCNSVTVGTSMIIIVANSSVHIPKLGQVRDWRELAAGPRIKLQLP